MAKSPDAFRTISEVSDWLDTPAHVLRFWESKFSQIKPVKRAGGRRYYRPEDMDLLGGIKTLLHDEGMTIKGVQKLLREKGVKHVAGLGIGAKNDSPDTGSIDTVAEFVPVPEFQPKIVETNPDTPTPTDTDIIESVVARARQTAPDVGPDPSDDDFSGQERFIAALSGVDRRALRRKSAQIAPLVARLDAVRASIARD